MAEIYLPTLLSFANGNVFTGSCGLLRFRIEPKVAELNNKEVNMEASSLLCQIWHGEKCYELSEMEIERCFPMSEEGIREIKQWLSVSV